MHPLHDVPVDLRRIATAVPVVVEVPLGREEALRTLEEALALYRKEFGAARSRRAPR